VAPPRELDDEPEPPAPAAPFFPPAPPEFVAPLAPDESASWRHASIAKDAMTKIPYDARMAYHPFS